MHTSTVILCIILGILLLGGLAAYIVANLLVRMALTMSGDRSAVNNAPHNQFDQEAAENAKARLAKREAWLSTVQREDMTLQSNDGLRLHAYHYAPAAQTSRWAIICHGYTGRASDMLDQARPLSQMGYHTLLPDARGHGQSEGTYIGMGWHERLDILRWIDEILQWDPQAQIILYGISMGAATVMMTSGEPLPENVKAIIEDCGYTSVWDEFAYQLRQIYHLPPFPVLPMASFLTKRRYGWSFREADATSQVRNNTRPLLCIHGTADTFVPACMVEEIYAAANEPKEKLLVQGAGHGAANVIGGDAYWDTVRRFLAAYIT